MNHDSFAFTPGQQLAAARKARGLSLADITERTRILEPKLEAIERDDYSAAGVAQPYVTGYVKAYAKQVGVPSAPLIKTLNAYYAQRERTDEEPEQAEQVKRSVSPAVYGVLLVVLLGLGGYAFYIAQQAKGDNSSGNSSEASEPGASSLENSPANSNAAAARQLLSGQSVNSEVLGSQQDADVPGNGVSRFSAKPTHSDPSHSTTVVQPPASNSIADDAMISAPNSRELNAVEPSAVRIGSASSVVRIDNAPSALAKTLGSGKDELLLQFNEDCWIDVRDASGNTLATKLAKTGEALRLRGEAPFNLKLGNAPGVNVAVNGRSVDVVPASGRKVVRLQLGP